MPFAQVPLQLIWRFRAPSAGRYCEPFNIWIILTGPLHFVATSSISVFVEEGTEDRQQHDLQVEANAPVTQIVQVALNALVY